MMKSFFQFSRSLMIVMILLQLGVVNLAAQAQSNGGRDNKRKGGGDRGNCEALTSSAKTAALSEDLTLLVPAKGEVLTANPTPTLWVYLPYAQPVPLSARLTLRDEQEKLVGTPIFISLPKTPGLVSLKLPQPLEVNKSYHWYFSVLCNEQKPSKNPFVAAWIRRVQPDGKLLSQMSQVSPIAQVRAYEKAGIWSEALTVLAQRRDLDTQATSEWQKLLKSEGLEAVAQKSILPCCTPKQ